MSHWNNSEAEFVVVSAMFAGLSILILATGAGIVEDRYTAAHEKATDNGLARHLLTGDKGAVQGTLLQSNGRVCFRPQNTREANCGPISFVIGSGK